jgi:hypothetical protein
LDWIELKKSNPIQYSSKKNNKKSKNPTFGFLELDLVGCPIIHPIRNPEKS